MESPEILPVAARPQEQLLCGQAAQLSATRVITNTLGRGQFAAAYAAAHPDADVTCWSLDLFQHQLIAADPRTALPNLRLLCSTDWPDERFDLAAVLVQQRGDGELIRDLLQQAAQRLSSGGTLLAVTDNPTDSWLGEQLERLCTKIARRAHDTGVVYHGVVTAPPKKIKHYDAEFVFRDRAALLNIKTRPGVFSHREIDPGARALLRGMYIHPGARVLEIGCGSGVVAIAAAARGAEMVHAIDSNARAVECLQWGASNNQLANIDAVLDCDGRSVAPGSFQIAIANPPYFANYRIAELFARIAAGALRPRGQCVIVTKTPQWYADHLPALGLVDVEVEPAKNYVLVRATRDLV